VFRDLGPLRVRSVELPGMSEPIRGSALTQFINVRGMNLDNHEPVVEFE